MSATNRCWGAVVALRTFAHPTSRPFDFAGLKEWTLHSALNNSRFARRSSSSAPSSTIPIGQRRSAPASSRTSCILRWRRPAGSGLRCRSSTAGSGLGITEAAIMMQAIAESGAAMSGASAVHMNIFGLQPVVVFGTEEQKQRMLPPMIAGRDKACFAVTEPDAGLDTTNLKVRAERRGDHYLLSGQKIWISSAQVANKVLILARTTPLDAGQAQDRRSHPFLHRSRSQPRRHSRHRQDGPACRRLRTRCSSTPCRSLPPTASATRERGSAPFSTE